MSKTIEAIGLVVAGAGLVAIGALVPGAQFLEGLGVSVALAGVGVALRPKPGLGGPANTLTFNNGPAPRRVGYGQFETAPVLTYASFPASQNLSTTNQYLHLVYTLFGHEISSFDGISINGTPYNFGTDLVWDTNLWHLYPGSNPAYNDIYWQHMFFEFDFGRNQSTQPFPELAASDSSWTSACIQQGCAKVHVILRADSGWTALYPSGQIPNIKFLVTGKKLIDPRVVTAWQPSTTYFKYQYIVAPNGLIWVQTNASGVSGTTSPAFALTGIPTTESDNTCSWTTYGQSQTSISQGTDGSPQGHIVNGRLVNDSWAPNSGYAPNDIIEAPLGYLQMATNSGTTSASEPTTFSKTLGGTTTDNTQDWVCLGRSWNAINPSNPALIVNDYLQNSDFGMDAAASTIDESSVIAAANVCEEQALIIWNSDNTVVYENLYRCDGMFDFSSTRGNVLGALCSSMAGWVIPPGDLWHVFAGTYQTPTISLGDVDLRGSLKGDFRLSRRDMANSVKGKFTPAFLPSNPAAQSSMTLLPGIWQPQPYPAYQANGLAGKPNYLNTEDGGQIIRMDLDLDFVTSMWQAQRLAKIAMMRTRFPETFHLQCKLSAFQLEAGDTFFFTHAHWGITDGTYQVQQCALTLDAQKGTSEDSAPAIGVDLVARQTDPSIYEFTGPSSASDFGEYSPYGITGVMTGVE